MHGGAFLRPFRELGGVDGVVGLHGFYDGGVVVKEDLFALTLACVSQCMDGTGRGRVRRHWKVRKESGETHSAISSFEAIEFLLAGRPYLSRRNSLDTLLGDLPELVVFFSDEQDDACRCPESWCSWWFVNSPLSIANVRSIAM